MRYAATKRQHQRLMGEPTIRPLEIAVAVFAVVALIAVMILMVHGPIFGQSVAPRYHKHQSVAFKPKPRYH